MTSDLLKNINFIDILARAKKSTHEQVLNLENYLYHGDFEDPIKESGLFSIGVHPWQVNDEQTNLEELKLHVQKSCCVAIGETGLDKLRGPDLKLQEATIYQSYKIEREELQKPLIIHCVKAYSEIIALHKNLNPKMPWVFHDFNHNAQFINSLKAKNIYFSLGENFFNRKQSKINKSFAEIDLTKIFFETDEMDTKVEKVYERYSERTSVDKKDLIKAIKANFQKVFMP